MASIRHSKVPQHHSENASKRAEESSRSSLTASRRASGILPPKKRISDYEENLKNDAEEIAAKDGTNHRSNSDSDNITSEEASEAAPKFRRTVSSDMPSLHASVLEMVAPGDFLWGIEYPMWCGHLSARLRRWSKQRTKSK